MQATLAEITFPVLSRTSLTVVLVIVLAHIGSENLAKTFAAVATPVAPAGGMTRFTVGCVLSTINVRAVDVEEVLSAASVAVAV